MSDTFPRVGSALLVRDEANRILLGQRNKDPQRGAWVIPGGKIHAFETIAAAAAREMEEETGLKVEVQSQFGVYEIVDPPTEHRLVIYSWGKVVGGNLKPSDDLSDVRFLSIDELGEVPTTPLVKKVLGDAGLLPGVRRPTAPQQIQLTLWVPILLAGANEASSSYSAPHRQRGARVRRPRRVLKSPLLFDIHGGT
jgi:ADP-ribose pyrophosphatase YjhB (NUDIX family)